MGTLKWIGGLLGWASGGPIGALLGIFIGSIFESGLDTIKQLSSGGEANAYGQGRTPHSARPGGYSATEQRNSFLMSLLVLSSAVIRADGKFLQSEMDYVRQFIRRNFGPQSEDEAMRMLEELNTKEINVYSVGAQISAYMNYSQRLQLFHYLADLANADGNVCDRERSVLQAIAAATGVSSSDAESVLAMFRRTADSAYTVLEISPSATDDEVKTAYRRLAMKNHPDKVATLGPEVQKAAEEKFRKIQEAYETIKKERGL